MQHIQTPAVNQQSVKQIVNATLIVGATLVDRVAIACVMNYMRTGRIVSMSELQDVIATSTIRAYNHGMRTERERILRIINQHEAETNCNCNGCESWINAFELLKVEINE